MSLTKIKELFEQGMYDQVLVHFEELNEQDRLEGSVFKMSSLFFKNWIKSDRYKLQDAVLELGKDIIAEAQDKRLVFIEIQARLARCEILRLNYKANLFSDPRKGDFFREQWMKEINSVEALLQNMKQDSLDPPDEFQASLLQQQGMHSLQLNDFTKAESYLAQSIKLCEKNRYIHLLANAYQLLGWVKEKTNEFKTALNYYEQALTYFQQLPNENEMAIVCHNLAEGYASLGQYDQAIKYNRK
ncbi:MAG: tetratricopeptide repeat protein, partial [Candidatus Hodarchaeales archaeon]